MANESPHSGDTTVPGPSWGRRPGMRIASFELVDRLDAGSNNQFGEVWLAQRSQPLQRVAIKFLRRDRLDPDMLRRFTSVESRALARFNHPFVARFFELNADGEVPYLVMEYVPGDSICRYCDSHRLGLRDRLELMAKVCEAVQHVHLQGVIHRDLKPQNILVTEPPKGDAGGPIPKLIDFGLAKSDNPDAPLGSAVSGVSGAPGTRKYMSPEQLRSSRTDETGREADIYALGAVLFEMLVGDSPMERVLSDDRLSGSERLARLERDERPHPADAFSTVAAEERARRAADRGIDESALRSALASRLAHITDRALRLDPKSRFSSAAAMAADIRAYLAQRDYAEAAAEPRFARAVRTVRRNKLPFAAAALVVLALSAGLVLALWGQAQSEREAKRAERLLGMSTELLGQLFSDDGGSKADLVPILERLEPEVRAGLGDEDFMPGIAVAVSSGLRQVGRVREAESLASAALDRIRDLYGPDDERTIDAELNALLLRLIASQDLGAAADDAGIAAQVKAIEEVRDGLRALAERAALVLGPRSELRLSIGFNAAAIEMQLDRSAEAVSALRPLLVAARQSLDPASSLLAEARIQYLVALFRSWESADAVGPERAREYRAEAFRESDAIRSDFLRLFGPDDGRTLRAAANHAMLLHHDGRFDEARVVLEPTVPAMRAVLGDANTATLLAINAQAEILERLGDEAGAREFLRAVLPALRSTRAGEPRHLADIEERASRLGLPPPQTTPNP